MIERDDGVRCHAWFSEDRAYRYSLTRMWGPRAQPYNVVGFIGLNPSTATETEDDPTVRRCVGYARDWGFNGMVMLNIFAFRATDPRVMKRCDEPIGEQNDLAIGVGVGIVDLVVACWGAHGDHLLRGRQVAHDLRNLCRDRLRVFGLTKGGHPKHPLYLAKTTTLKEW